MPIDSKLSEARRQRVLALLAAEPGPRYVIVQDERDDTYRGFKVFDVAIRSFDGTEATFDLVIRNDRLAAYTLDELLECHGNATDCTWPC